MKLYILVLDDVPDNFVPVVCAHSSLMAHLEWHDKGIEGYDDWLKNYFKKCVVSVNQKEFERAKTFENVKLVHEKGLDNREVALVLCPRKEYDKAVRFYKLWKPKV